jgi:hypothetical protein
MDVRAVATHMAAASGHGALRANGPGFFVCCPAHDDRQASLHVSPGRDGGVVLHCHAGCEATAVLLAADLTWADLGLDSHCAQPDGGTETYRYQDESGAQLFAITRIGHGPGKRFRSSHLDADGQLVHDARGVRRVLYHLPEVAEAVAHGRPVYLCEGEKDADALLGAYGVCATTNPFGATAWARDCAKYGFADHLHGAEVVVVQDRDVAGAKRTRQILASLTEVAAALRVVQAAHGKDAADHVAAGLTLDELVAVIPGAPDGDDGSFAALPQSFFETAESCGLSHLEYRVLVEVARHSVRREHQKVVWQALTCPSSWLARCCGGASPTQVRRVLGRLRDAGILSDESADGPRHTAAVVRVQGDLVQWRPVSRREPPRKAELSPESTAPASCEDTSTRTDLGLRERRIGRSG